MLIVCLFVICHRRKENCWLYRPRWIEIWLIGMVPNRLIAGNVLGTFVCRDVHLQSDKAWICRSDEPSLNWRQHMTTRHSCDVSCDSISDVTVASWFTQQLRHNGCTFYRISVFYTDSGRYCVIVSYYCVSGDVSVILCVYRACKEKPHRALHFVSVACGWRVDVLTPAQYEQRPNPMYIVRTILPPKMCSGGKVANFSVQAETVFQLQLTFCSGGFKGRAGQGGAAALPYSS